MLEPDQLAKLSKLESLAFESGQDLRSCLQSLSDDDAEEILYDWRLNARPNQLLPGTPGAAVDRSDWLIWLPLAGRGWGKTRVGAETVREWAEDPTERIMLIGATTADVRDTMIEGPSGLLACYPSGRKPIWEPTRHRIQFPSGAIGITRSADEPERLRGPQFRRFWFDELAASRYARQAWDQLMFGFRQPGRRIQGLVTTTPKPISTLKEIIADPDTVVTRGSSDENILNLNQIYIRKVLDPYRGTRLGRQEIEAELLEDTPGALWTRTVIDQSRILWESIKWDRIVRIVVAVDPAVTAKENSDETGIVVVALLQSRHALMIEDGSGRMTAGQWAHKAVTLYRKWKADCIVAETNQGGDLVEAVLRNVDANIAYKGVHAKRGKFLRAEPVSSLYEQGRIHHAGNFRDLEDQMVSWTPQGDEDSPDRLDALVYGITELLVDNSIIQIAQQFMRPVEVW
jgi:phage terminase large subunit-like protein